MKYFPFFSLLWMSVLCGLLALQVASPTVAVLPEAEQSPETVEALIKQLGSRTFKVREAAERALLRRADAVPALRRAVTSSDKDLARRAARILKAFGRRDDRRARERLEALGKAGKIAQAVEVLVQRHQWGDEEDAAWQVFAALAGKLLDFEKQRFGKAPIEALLSRDGTLPGTTPEEKLGFLPFRDFRRYKKFARPQSLTSRNRELLLPRGFSFTRGEDVKADLFTIWSLVACAGRFRAGQFSQGAVFANGSVEVDDIACCVVVSDREIRVKDRLATCIIVARGPVWCPELMGRCVIISSGTVHASKKAAEGNVIRQNVARPFDFVRFFDPSTMGITVEKAKAGVRVSRVDKDKSFSRAGLRTGDTVTALGGKPVDSPDAFRTLLRRALAEGSAAKLGLLRDDKALDITVPIKD